MARAGMTRWRSRNCNPASDGNDEIQRSLDLLDKVLSEFDDIDNSNMGTVERSQSAPSTATWIKGCTTSVEDSSPSGLGGHQSEDDGYMSMNGRKAKLIANLKQTSQDECCSVYSSNRINKSHCINNRSFDLPPPPQEAERIISNLLPRVSPYNSTNKMNMKTGKEFLSNVASSIEENALDSHGRRVTTATQTTLPKTKHQRPFGWQKESGNRNHRKKAPNTSFKFGSLPCDGAVYYETYPSPWLQWQGYVPPRTVAVSSDRHREVKRCTETDSLESGILNTVIEMTDDDQANFSDDSLEDIPPPPLPVTQQNINKRGSIAWEVPLDQNDEAFFTPGSTKVVGRRRKKSTDRSSTSSLSTSHMVDDWPEPPNCNEGSLSCLTTDTDLDNSIEETYPYLDIPKTNKNNSHGTYVIRRGNKKDRKLLNNIISSEGVSYTQIHATNGELKRCSSTFDNIKSLLKDGLVEGLDDSPPDFPPPHPPNLVRVISLPNILSDSNYEKAKYTVCREIDVKQSKSTDVDYDILDSNFGKQSIATQVSADFSSLNKQILEQSISCQTDNFELNYCSDRDIKPDIQIASNKNDEIEQVGDEIQSNIKLSKNKNDENEPVGHEVQNNIKLSSKENEESRIDSSIEDLLTFENKSEKKKELKLEIAKEVSITDTWLSVSEIPEIKKVSVMEKSKIRLCNGNIERPPGDFPVKVEILHHEFGPLPPSPVEEVEEIEEEYSDVVNLEHTSRLTNGLRESYRYFDNIKNDSFRKSSRTPEIPSHKEPSLSLKTRSVDAGFTRNHRSQFSGSRREIPVERRTLPTDLPGTSHRRPYQKRSSHSPRDELNCHVSCSLPETPIFTRGCDIPRTPLRSTDIPSSLRATPRLNGIQTTGYVRNMGLGHGTSVGEAMAGIELLRMTGPGRGWYPRHRHPRPASVEHLDRLAPQGISPNAPSVTAWDTRDSRKPQTLPPNLSPKFFQRSPREALRRVTSLLIRKGGSKEPKAKDVFSSSVIGPHGDFGEASRQQKRGFFRSFFKKSRHYSLDQQ